MNTEKKRFRESAAINIAVVVLGVFLVFFLIMVIQTSYAADRQRTNTYAKLENAERRLEQNQKEAQENWDTFCNAMNSKMQTAVVLLNRINCDWTTLRNLSDSAGFDRLAVYSDPATLKFGNECATEEIRKQLFAGESFAVQEQGEDYIAWFSAPLKDGSRILGSKKCTQYALTQQKLGSVDYALNELALQEDAHILLLERGTENLVFASDALSRSAFQLGRHSRNFVVIDDVRYAYTAYEGSQYTFISLMPQKTISESVQSLAAVLTAVFALILILVCLYAQFIREEFEADAADQANHADTAGQKKFWGISIDATLYYKARNVIFLAMVSVFLLCVFLQMLGALGNQHLASEKILEDLDGMLTENDSRVSVLSDQYAADYTARANEIALILAKDPSLLNREDITRIAETQGVSTLYVFDENGNTVATNDVYQDFVVSTNPEDQSYAFWPVLKGYTDAYVQEIRPDSTSEHRMMQYIGVRRQDAPGMVQVGVSPTIISQRLASTKLNEVLGVVTVENGGILFAADPESGNLVYWQNAKDIGRSAANVGLKQSALKDRYAGWQRLDGHEYYVNSLLHKQQLLFTAIPREAIYAHVVTVALVVTLNCALLTCVVLYMLLRSSMMFGAGFATVEGAAPESRTFFTIFRNNRRQSTQDAVSRWNGAVLRFSGMNPEQKLKRVLSGITSVLTIVIFILFEVSQTRTIHPILSLILSSRWERSLNIFALSYVLIVTMEILVTSLAVRALIGWFSMGVNTRSETVGRMIQNFIKYFAIIGAILYGIQFFGVDSTTIITGTGIITLGVSLGSQSLVADIMAGIFIVFEGEFRVGDIITIDDFRGTVEEIGIRTTKVNKAGNIKIYRNSQISGVLNMTKENSFAVCAFQVSYRTDLRQLEDIFRLEFPKIREHIPELTSDIVYMGVSELSESGVTIMVRGSCEESKRFNVERALNREMKLLLDDYNVEIPFPQVVVHRPTNSAMIAPVQPAIPELTENEAENPPAEDTADSDMLDSAGAHGLSK